MPLVGLPFKLFVGGQQSGTVPWVTSDELGFEKPLDKMGRRGVYSPACEMTRDSPCKFANLWTPSLEGGSKPTDDKRLALQFSQSLWGTKPTLPTPSCPFRGAGSDSQTREMTKDSPCKSANLWTLSSEGCVKADLASFVSTLRPVR